MTDNTPNPMDLNIEELKKLKEIVLARLQVMPDDMTVTVGSEGLDKKDLTEHVESEDEIGKQLMEMELEYLRDLASGAIYGNE